MNLTLPLTKEAVKPLRIGDVIELSGDLYTARDAAHKRLDDAVKAGLQPPIPLFNQSLIYTGPAPAKPGQIIGSFSPTTSLRMDAYVDMCLSQGVTAMIGKGDRSPFVAELCKRYGAVYLLAIGGAAAMYAACVSAMEVVAYEDLGTESIKRLTVNNFKVIVGIDTNGGVLQDREIPKYRR